MTTFVLTTMIFFSSITLSSNPDLPVQQDHLHTRAAQAILYQIPIRITCPQAGYPIPASWALK